MEKVVETSKHDKIFLHTFDNDEDLKKFYEKFGFEEVKKIKNFYRRLGCDGCEMWLKI